MTITPADLKIQVEVQLSSLKDTRVLSHIRDFLIEPEVVWRDWSYGVKDQTFPCWTVFQHPSTNTGIAYCEQGFGPECPWGLVGITGGRWDLAIGMDSGWFGMFLEAYFDSFAATELDIWRVFEGSSGIVGYRPISEEASWDDTWFVIERLRLDDPHGCYNCDQTAWRRN